MSGWLVIWNKLKICLYFVIVQNNWKPLNTTIFKEWMSNTMMGSNYQRHPNEDRNWIQLVHYRRQNKKFYSWGKVKQMSVLHNLCYYVFPCVWGIALTMNIKSRGGLRALSSCGHGTTCWLFKASQQFKAYTAFHTHLANEKIIHVGNKLSLELN